MKKKEQASKTTRKPSGKRKAQTFTFSLKFQEHLDKTAGFITPRGDFRPGDFPTAYYSITINRSQPFYLNIATFAKESNPSQVKKFLEKHRKYIRGNLEGMIISALSLLSEEATVFSDPHEDVEKSITGLEELIRETHGTVFEEPVSKSYFYFRLSRIAYEVVDRLRGYDIGNPSNVKAKGIRLNANQVRDCARHYYYTLARCSEIRQVQRTHGIIKGKELAKKRGKELRLSDAAIANLLERDTGRGYKWKPSEVAIVEAARAAGVKGIKINSWNSVRRRIKEALKAVKQKIGVE